MNNKGFTLIEVLAVIVLLVIIMVIAAPNITKQINRKEKEEQNLLNEKIENASMLYVSKYYLDDILSPSFVSISFTLKDLQEDGLININKNGNCKNVISKDIIVYNFDNVIKYDYSNLENCYK